MGRLPKCTCQQYAGTSLHQADCLADLAYRSLQAQLDEERRTGDWMVKHGARMIRRQDSDTLYFYYGAFEEYSNQITNGDWRKAVLEVMDE